MGQAATAVADCLAWLVEPSHPPEGPPSPPSPRFIRASRYRIHRSTENLDDI
jgi:hypothetical protein